ncbi:septum formation initiator [Streptomyces sp. CB03234]|uniref:TadE/TadG family type IV pilus assembly protein n=1 Tax=Streptomyces sp. (strain CB03234) TaxID=1703937 RepID=UPI00093CDB90|nr:TadE/TadG family type IV pilus assembly protein [Streptomyces sp. CB03234]OKK06218.1 septum formation initiator [Streptomyces sp. CB03234]
MRRRHGNDRGQVAVEFTGMVPVVLGVIVLLWQAALVGYAWSLAGNAADAAARAGTVGGAGACAAAAQGSVSGAWTAQANCYPDGDLYTASVDLNVPVLFPGFDIPVPVTGTASVAREGDR